MKINNYRFILADDHKGNKALTVIKGEFNRALVTGDNVGEIDDSNFKDFAEKLINILDQTTIKKITENPAK